MSKFLLHVKVERVDDETKDRYGKVESPKSTTEMASIHMSSTDSDAIKEAAISAIQLALSIAGQ